MRPARIVSGGQTGVDRAALDVARELGIPSGGWCPAGGRAEDGRVPARYGLQETPSADPAERTAWNVRDSDATLVLAAGELRGGTLLCEQEAERLGRPWRRVRLPGSAQDLAATRDWLDREPIRTLNVAGPRASEEPESGLQAASFLRRLLAPEASDG